MYFLWYLLIGLVAGWIASLIVKGSGSGMLVNLIVGIIGEYIAILFSELKDRPIYIVEETQNVEKKSV